MGEPTPAYPLSPPRSSRHLAAWLLLALLLQGTRTYVFYSHTNADRLVQVEVASHLAAGRGWVRAVPAATDLAAVHYRPEAGWPPGYSLLLWPLYALSGDWFQAVMWGDALGLLLLFGGLWRWLRQWPGLRPAEGGLLAVSWGILFAPFAYLGSTDLWAGAALLHALVALHRPRLLVAGLWLGLACSMRYAAYPWVGLLVLASAESSPRPWRQMLLAWLLALGPTLTFQLLMPAAGSIYENPRLETPRWLFPEHLLMTDVFPVKAMVYLHPAKLAAVLGWPVTLVSSLLWGLGLAVLGGAGMALCRLPGPLTRRLLALSFLTIAPLAALSLLVPPEIWQPGTRWTFLAESRYYFPVMLLMPILLIRAAIHGTGSPRWLAPACLVVLLAGGLLHAGGRWYELLAQPQPRISQAAAFAGWQQQLITAAAGPGPVVAIHDGSHEAAFRLQVATWAGATLMSRDQLLAHSGYTSAPLRLLLHLPEAEAQALAHQLGMAPPALRLLTLPEANLPPVYELWWTGKKTP